MSVVGCRPTYLFAPVTSTKNWSLGAAPSQGAVVGLDGAAIPLNGRLAEGGRGGEFASQSEGLFRQAAAKSGFNADWQHATLQRRCSG